MSNLLVTCTINLENKGKITLCAEPPTLHEGYSIVPLKVRLYIDPSLLMLPASARRCSFNTRSFNKGLQMQGNARHMISSCTEGSSHCNASEGLRQASDSLIEAAKSSESFVCCTCASLKDFASEWL